MKQGTIFAGPAARDAERAADHDDGSPVGPPDYETGLVDVSDVRRRLAQIRHGPKLNFVRRRLDYIELIVWFAFEEKVFLIIFFIAGFLTILISVILWTSVRLTTMLENPPRVRIWSTLLLIVVPPFQGVLLASFRFSWPKCPCRCSSSFYQRLATSAPRRRRLGALEPSTPSRGLHPRFSPRRRNRSGRGRALRVHPGLPRASRGVLLKFILSAFVRPIMA